MDPWCPSPAGVGDISRSLASVCLETDAPAARLEADFAEFYEGLFPRVYPFVRSQVPNVETAQELVSRIFVKACHHWPGAPRGEAASYWLFRIARTTVIDYWRVEGRRRSVSVSIDELADMPDAGASPETICSAKERAGLLLRIIGMLEPQDRELLLLKFMGQRTNREIAAILELTDAAVSMRLVRALRRLRDRLADAGVS